MKTTVDIPDTLLDEIKRVAARDKTTVRALIEYGLRQVWQNVNVYEAFIFGRPRSRDKDSNPIWKARLGSNFVTLLMKAVEDDSPRYQSSRIRPS